MAKIVFQELLVMPFENVIFLIRRRVVRRLRVDAKFPVVGIFLIVGFPQFDVRTMSSYDFYDETQGNEELIITEFSA